MSTSNHHISRSEMDGTAQSDDRRQQTDRRRVSGRRKTDQTPGESSQLDGIKNEQTEQQAENIAHHRKKNHSSKPIAYALSEDEIKFLLADD
ncbi:MAG: hypothetical protein EOL86_13970 [Deltaproteobacteria bacterium]|nr:hypothetical protein [Deltaproteobacteria bacterium]